MSDDAPTISAFGEKRLIAEFIRPLFNRQNAVGGVGDDCAMLDLGGDQLLLLSTDRVPADLTAFRLGILDYRGLGRYLACLNLSDIAACGGVAEALLLNLGLPADLPYADFQSLCEGFGGLADEFGCQVLGGDITQSSELSISATSVGRVKKGQVLTRRGSKPGDSIFLSKPLGLTPAAFAAYLRTTPEELGLDAMQLEELRGQFTGVRPMLKLGERLVTSEICSSCMDNTDGIGQSLSELGAESGVALVVDSETILVPSLVERIARALGEEPLRLAFSAGADFSLVGTLRGAWTRQKVEAAFGENVIQIIGHVEAGSGVWAADNGGRASLVYSGWNYFAPPSIGEIESAPHSPPRASA